MTPQQRSALIKLAADMALGNGLPPVVVSELGLPKSTPVTARRQIAREMESVRQRAIKWAKEIVRIVDES